MTAFLLWLALLPVEQVSLRGRVVDGRTGEPLARVELTCLPDGPRATTAADGRFTLNLPDGADCNLRAIAVGYRPLTEPVKPGDELDVLLVPDSLARRESLTVPAGPFQEPAPEAIGLAGSELRNLASVLADDPMRAIQGLPGVTAQDDFQSEFALRGAGFQRIGLLLDGVLLHQPFHSVQALSNSASIASFQGEILDSANLFAGPLPSRYSDRTGGVLDLRSRDGNNTRKSGRISASSTAAGATVEGPLGKHGSWLASGRQSYLQYIVNRATDEPNLGFGFRDAQFKTTWRGASLLLMQGYSALDRETTGLNSIALSGFHSTLAVLTYRRSGTRWTGAARSAFLRESYTNRNRATTPLQAAGYGEWAGSGDVSRSWGESGATEFGASLRRIRTDGYADRLPSPRLDQWRGVGRRWGVYAQQSGTLLSKFRWEAGMRGDGHSLAADATALPFASLSAGLWKGARLSASYAQAAQFPDIEQYTSLWGGSSLLPERSVHTQLTFEQSFGSQTRLRIEAYNREDRNLLFRPLFEPRIRNGVIFAGQTNARWANSSSGFARGLHVFLQRRAANRISGWLSYAYNRSDLKDQVAAVTFPMDYDMAHSVRAYASVRLRPTWNLSGRFVYATGLPVPGFFEPIGGVPYLSTQRNRLRLPDYQRTDVRLNKAFTRGRTQWTLFVELINLTNRRNTRFDSYNGFEAATRRVRLTYNRLLPIVPSAGLVVDF